MAKEDWSEAKAWMRATRERIGMTQHDAAVLANLTVDMVKKYESEKYRIQPSGRMREMLEHYLAEHRRAVVAIVERHRGDEGLRVKMCVWLGVSRGLDLAFLNAD